MTSLSNSNVNLGAKSNEKKKSSEKVQKTSSDEQNEMELLLKRLPVLNDYFHLHNKIGKGTFSTVYLATLKNSNSTQKYAVKHLTQAYEQSRIQNELNCLQKIGGKDNVVPAELCLTNGDDCVTFIMPYLPHLRFSDYVVEMDAEETRCYMKNLFIALRRVHSFNIIHRDVKPDNFLYNREIKQFLLVDFGLAQLVRTPSKDVKGKSLADENIPIDYSKKRKRVIGSSDDDEGACNKTNKRIALKLKDGNVKTTSTSKFLTETKPDLEKTPNQRKDDLKSPIKQWTGRPDIDQTPVKSRVNTTINVPSNSRRKLLDSHDISTPRSTRKESPFKNQSETAVVNSSGSNKLLRDMSFTPLIPSKSSNAKFIQVKNSRVVRQQSMPPNSKIENFQKQIPSTSFGQSCPCSGIAAICSICASRKPMFAPRAGTSGFRPPEVLFRYLHQTTAVDMWASGVVMLCILSGCYPFFNSSSDLHSLAEIMTIFGTERTIKIASKFGRRIVCSEHSKGVDLKKLCTRLRARFTKESKGRKSTSNEPKCRDCLQVIRKDGCLCPSDERSNEGGVAESDIPCQFPDSAFDLLYRLLDLDPTTRITAAEALEHPFITGQ